MCEVLSPLVKNNSPLHSSFADRVLVSERENQVCWALKKSLIFLMKGGRFNIPSICFSSALFHLPALSKGLIFDTVELLYYNHDLKGHIISIMRKEVRKLL